jgi:hypothetical protein
MKTHQPNKSNPNHDTKSTLRGNPHISREELKIQTGQEKIIVYLLEFGSRKMQELVDGPSLRQKLLRGGSSVGSRPMESLGGAWWLASLPHPAAHREVKKAAPKIEEGVKSGPAVGTQTGESLAAQRS